MGRSTASTKVAKQGASAEEAAFPPLTVTIPSLLLGGSDRTFRELVSSLLDIGSQVHELRLFLAERLGVSEPQYRVVLAIARLQMSNGVSVGAVAEHLGVSRNFVTMEIRKLEAMGMVTKRTNPEDGRGVLLQLSPKGRGAYLSVIETIQLINNTMYGHLASKDLMVLLNACKNIVRDGRRALDIARAYTPKPDARPARKAASKPRARSKS